VSLHVAAVLGDEPAVRRLIAQDQTQVKARAGNAAADPLLWLCYSPFHGESPERDEGLIASARALLDAGADPNTRDAQGLPALYAATGLNDAPRVARLLLEAGADPTDGESVFHAAERFHEEALELLFEYGVELNARGDWGNTPLYFLLRYWDASMPRVRRGFEWLLDHGADPDVQCGTERETSLHVAVRRGQDPAIVRLLLERGPDVHARRADGLTPWRLGRRGGFDELSALLEAFGAVPEPLSPADELLAACGRGDAEAAVRLTTPALVSALDSADAALLPQAAARARVAVVNACLAAGFSVDTPDEFGATALHHAAIHGYAGLVEQLLRARADFRILDAQHRASPLGWACFGADHVREAGGDYAATAAALLEAGAGHSSDDYDPSHPGVREVLRRYGGEAGRHGSA
jgi:ankyrin repeat protein